MSEHSIPNASRGFRVQAPLVCIGPDGFDRNNNLVASVYYRDGEWEKSLAMELAQNGLAKCVQWSLNMMLDDARHDLKAAESLEKKSRLNVFTDYEPRVTKNTKATQWLLLWEIETIDGYRDY